MLDSSIYFKKTLSFTSCIILASFVFSHKGVAMDPGDEEITPQFPSKASSITLNKEVNSPIAEVNDLIAEAKNGNFKAQDKLIHMTPRKDLLDIYLTPEYVGFLQWKEVGQWKEDLENHNINALHADLYTFFVIKNYEKIGRNFPNLFQITKERADKYIIEAQKNLGIMYSCGYGVEENNKKAFTYYKRAADQGDAHMLFNVGLLYRGGIGVEKNEEKAFEYYKRAADQGQISAPHWVAQCYRNGTGVEKNEEEAKRFEELDRLLQIQHGKKK